MPTLDDVYRKFGEAAEAAQLVEINLGTMMLFVDAVRGGMITETLEVDGKRAGVLLDKINRQTLGTLLKNAKGNQSIDQLEGLLSRAVKERNRLSHSFFREHNFRRNSDEGRQIMMDDLESIHTTLLDALKSLLLLSGIDLEAEVAAGHIGLPTGHLPI